MLRSQRAQGVKKFLDRAVPLEEMHVLNTAEIAVKSRRDNDDGHMRTPPPQKGRDLRAKLARAKVVVEDGNVDRIEQLDRLINRCGRDALVAMLSQNCRTKIEVIGFVIEQQDPDWLDKRAGHSLRRAGKSVRRLNHGVPLRMLLNTTIVTI